MFKFFEFLGILVGLCDFLIFCFSALPFKNYLVHQTLIKGMEMIIDIFYHNILPNLNECKMQLMLFRFKIQFP